MQHDGLFSLNEPGGMRTAPPAATESGFTRPGADSPLPVRMRPASIDELVGQKHLLAPGAPLRQLVTGTTPMSVILWGPPGTGKTTIAHLVAAATDRKFVAMSALTAGVKDVRAVIDTARRERRAGGPPTVLFIDEVHRFSKTQQDSLLAAVEDRTVTLLAATTENPYFSVISPLLSRCVLLTLHNLDEADIRRLIRRAVTDERGLGGAVTLTSEAEDHLVRLASGDVRKALTALEAAAGSAQAQGAAEIDLSTAEKAVDVAAVRYDRDGDAHYDVTSAFIKSMRGSDPDAALHWLARMLVAGEDPRFIARRIVIFASEDVGMADPQSLLIATAAAQAVQNVGLPEAGLNLAQAVIHLATAPKSNSATNALFAAMADVRAGKGGPVPAHLRDAHYPGSKGLGHGRGYRYPHDDPRGVVRQQYAPDDIADTEYYTPTDHGAERAMTDRLPRLRRIVRGTPLPPDFGTARSSSPPGGGSGASSDPAASPSGPSASSLSGSGSPRGSGASAPGGLGASFSSGAGASSPGGSGASSAEGSSSSAGRGGADGGGASGGDIADTAGPGTGQTAGARPEKGAERAAPGGGTGGSPVGSPAAGYNDGTTETPRSGDIGLSGRDAGSAVSSPTMAGDADLRGSDADDNPATTAGAGAVVSDVADTMAPEGDADGDTASDSDAPTITSGNGAVGDVAPGGDAGNGVPQGEADGDDGGTGPGGAGAKGKRTGARRARPARGTRTAGASTEALGSDSGAAAGEDQP
jgi:putative ATPase